jgi:hypothetical protein
MSDKLRKMEANEKSNTEKGNASRDHIKLRANEADRGDQRQDSQDLGHLKEALPNHQETAKRLHQFSLHINKYLEEAKKGTLSPDLVDNYNHVENIFHKLRDKLVAFNDKIEKYNATRPKGTSEVEKLDLPKQLEPFNTKSNGESYQPEGTSEVEKKPDLPDSDLKRLNIKSNDKSWKIARIHGLCKIAVAFLALTSGFHATNAQLNHDLAINGPGLLQGPIHPGHQYHIINPLNYRNKGTNWEDMKKMHFMDTPLPPKKLAKQQEKLKQLTPQQAMFQQYKLHLKARPLDPRAISIPMVLWWAAGFLNQQRKRRQRAQLAASNQAS